MSAPDVQGAPPRATRLVRSRDDRMIAGVAGGLGHHLGVDPVVVRLVFVVLALAGGIGLVAYPIAWIVIPEASASGQPEPDGPARSGASVVAGLVLVALGGMLLLDRLVPMLSWRYVGPALLIGLGMLLLVRRGDDR